MTSTPPNSMDWAGVSEFKEDLDKNIDYLDKNFFALHESRKNFFASVISFYRTQDRITDKQINALLPGWRELLNREGEVK